MVMKMLLTISNSNDTFSYCKSKVKGEIMGLRPIVCVCNY